MTDKEFRSFVRIIVLSRLPGNQKLLTIGAAVMSDDNGEATLGAEDMKRICSVSKRDTVFAAKRAIAEDGLGLVSTVTTFGRSNRYRVMPPAVLNSIIEAYNSRTTNIVDVPKSGTTPVPKKGTSTNPEKGDATRPEKGTGPIPPNGTSPEKGDGSRARAEVSNINNNNLLASVGDNSTRDAGQLAVLNGAKALIVEQLATWLSPHSPDTDTAERWLITATTLHGGLVVKEAFAELQAQIASGDVIARPIVVLNRICERIKKSPKRTTATQPGDAQRQIDAIVGRRT